MKWSIDLVGWIVILCILLTGRMYGQVDTLIPYINSQIDSGNHYVFSDNRKATQFYTIAEEKAENLQADSLLAKIYVGYGVIARLQGDYTTAFDNYEKALKIHHRLNDSIYIATHYHNIGLLYRYTDYFEESKEYLLKAVRLRTILKDSTELGISYTQLGIMYRKLDQLDSAAYYYERAYEIFKALDNQEEIVSVNGNWARLESARGNDLRALDINLQDIAYLETMTIPKNRSLAVRYNNVAQIYKRIEKMDLAIDYIDKAIAVAEEENYLDYLARFYRTRAYMFRTLEEYKSAFYDYRKYKHYRDTINDVQKVKAFTEQRVAFEYEQEQLADSLRFVAEQEKLEILAQSERNQKNFYLILAVLSSILAIGAWYFFKNKRKLAETEAQLLQKDLQNTQKEAERIVAEQKFRLEQKKKLKEKLEQLSNKSNDRAIIKELHTLALGMNIQLNQEKKSLVFEENPSDFNVAFEEKLIQLYSTLTKNERELCKLMWMNKSIPEIMALRNVSSAAVRSMRYRIRKKLGVSGEVELEQFLQQLGS